MLCLFSCRTEDQIRQYYANGGKLETTAAKSLAAQSSQQASGTAGAAAAAAAAALQHNNNNNNNQQQKQHEKVDLADQLSQLSLRFPATAVDSAAFKAWFPGLALSGTDTALPQAVVLCFHRQVS
jgi:endo-1,4-beta-D-glucanase Y